VIALQNIDLATLKANWPTMKLSFTETVSTLLKVNIDRVKNTRACKSGATNAECPAEVEADASAIPTTTGGNRRRRRMGEENACQVRYEVVSSTPAEMNAVKNDITGTNYQSTGTFTNAFKRAMLANGVNSSIVDSIVAKPDKITEEETKGGKAIDEDGSNGPNGTDTSADQNSKPVADDTNSNGLIYVVGVGVVLFLMLVIGFLCWKMKYTKKKLKSALSRQNSSIGSASNPMHIGRGSIHDPMNVGRGPSNLGLSMELEMSDIPIAMPVHDNIVNSTPRKSSYSEVNLDSPGSVVSNNSPGATKHHGHHDHHGHRSHHAHHVSHHSHGGDPKKKKRTRVAKKEYASSILHAAPNTDDTSEQEMPRISNWVGHSGATKNDYPPVQEVPKLSELEEDPIKYTASKSENLRRAMRNQRPSLNESNDIEMYQQEGEADEINL
jgi:hypothetical protein